MTDSEYIAHAKLSASGAKRWMTCPGSVKASEGLPDTESGFAFEGTCAHQLGEICLEEGHAPEDFIDRVIQLDEHSISKEFGSEFTVTEEMANYVAQYVDYCNALPGEKFVETRLDYSKWVPGGFGTGDFLSFDMETGILYVVDLKYGKGVKVYAEDNPQAALYGLGAYDNLSWMGDVLKVVMVIHQPRLDHVDEHTISVKALLEFAQEASDAADLALSDDAPFRPGEDQCKFCKVKYSPLGCEALDSFVMNEALDGFDVVDSEKKIQDVKPADKINTSKLAKILFARKMLEGWISSVEKRALDLCMEGNPPAGIKLIKGRKPNKSWNIDDAQILSKLKRVDGVPASKMYTTKVITPTQAAKILPKNNRLLKKFVDNHEGEGKLTMVPVTDERPAVDPLQDAADKFDEVN